MRRLVILVLLPLVFLADARMLTLSSAADDLRPRADQPQRAQANPAEPLAGLWKSELGNWKLALKPLFFGHYGEADFSSFGGWASDLRLPLLGLAAGRTLQSQHVRWQV